MTDKQRFLRAEQKVFRKTDDCALLATGFAANCATSPLANLEVDIWLFNRTDMDVAGSTIVGRKISLLALNSGKLLYKFVGKKTSNKSAISLAEGKYENAFIHLIGLIIFDNTPDTKANIIEILANANLCAITRNKWKGTGSNQEFELFGFDSGLGATALDKKSDDADTKSAWSGVLNTPKDETENNAGYIIDYGSQALTLAALEAQTDSGS